MSTVAREQALGICTLYSKWVSGLRFTVHCNRLSGKTVTAQRLNLWRIRRLKWKKQRAGQQSNHKLHCTGKRMRSHRVNYLGSGAVTLSRNDFCNSLYTFHARWTEDALWWPPGWERIPATQPSQTIRGNRIVCICFVWYVLSGEKEEASPLPPTLLPPTGRPWDDPDRVRQRSCLLPPLQLRPHLYCHCH